jgi:hypothetical protein
LGRSDEQRFRELYDRTYDPVWAFVLRRTPDEEAAADVVSETFVSSPTGGGARGGGDGSSNVFGSDRLIYLSIFR